MSEWQPSAGVARSIRGKAQDLINDFDENLANFDEIERTRERFSGPSLYFHYRCCSLFHAKAVREKLADERFFEYLYATLTSWGMHRMGDSPTKLVKFNAFVDTIVAQQETLEDLEGMSLATVDWEAALPRLVAVIDDMEVSASKSHLVANTKALHHVLPDLVPPIDRRYTLAFFGLNTMLPSQQRAGAIFEALFPSFARVASAVAKTTKWQVDPSRLWWHTSLTKLIDNAIMGAPSTQ